MGEVPARCGRGHPGPPGPGCIGKQAELREVWGGAIGSILHDPASAPALTSLSEALQLEEQNKPPKLLLVAALSRQQKAT